MKIAITADLHLVTQKEHTERLNALESILDTLIERKINHLIIAGDLFDEDCTQPGEFERIAKKPKYSGIQYFIIPGNHDPAISAATFVLEQINYFSQPTIYKFDNDLPFVFIPYTKGKTMGEILSSIKELQTFDEWFLVGHGDWISGRSEINQYEKGIYMPLSNRDIQIYKPKLAFLGHIHSAKDTSVVHYPGSACAIDPSECGVRSFLVYDSKRGEVERLPVSSQVIYFSVQLVVLPTDDEETYLKNEMKEIMDSWKLPASDLSKVKLQVKVEGYTRNRRKLVELIQKGFAPCGFLNENQPDISEVRIAEGLVQENVMKTARESLDKLDLNFYEYGINREEVLLALTRTIYGGGK